MRCRGRQALGRAGGAALPRSKAGPPPPGNMAPVAFPTNARVRPASQPVTLLYLAAACLVSAQLLGVYGLVTRKADLIFAVVMTALLISAIVLGGLWAYHRVH